MGKKDDATTAQSHLEIPIRNPKLRKTYLRPGDLSGDGTGPLLMLRRGPVLRRGILSSVGMKVFANKMVTSTSFPGRCRCWSFSGVCLL